MGFQIFLLSGLDCIRSVLNNDDIRPQNVSGMRTWKRPRVRFMDGFYIKAVFMPQIVNIG